MEKIDFKTQDKSSDSYADQVRDAEKTYGPLTDEMFNLGAELAGQTVRGVNFNPKAWAAWMRKAAVAVRGDKVYIGMTQDPSQWWLRYIFENFHNSLARHYNREVYYAMDGQVYNFANYGLDKSKRTEEELRYAAECFAQVKANVRAFVEKGEAMKDER